LLVYSALPGEYLEAGQLIAEIIDPIGDRVTPVHCANAGMVIAHVAGLEAYRTGYLLSP
jgi:hypothetical protein